MKKRLWLVILCILVISVSGYLFFFRNNKAASAETDPQYDFVRVQRMDLSEKVDLTGKVIFAKNDGVYPAYTGVITDLRVKAGSVVKKGDVLLNLDSPSLAESWNQLSYNYSQAEQNFSQAKKDLTRLQSLYEAEAVTADQVETARVKVDQTLEQWEMAKIKLDELVQNPDQTNFIDTDHRHLQIRAPFSGEVAWVNVRQDEKVTPQTLLLTLVDGSSLEVDTQVDETEIKTVVPGQKVLIKPADSDEEEVSGVVHEVGKVGKEESGVVIFPVRIKVNGSSRLFQPGMSVDLSIIASDKPNVLAVPSSIVTERRGYQMVPVQEGKEIIFQRVETGAKTVGYTEIISGLEEGMFVAVPKKTQTTTNSSQTDNRSSQNILRMGGMGGMGGNGGIGGRR